MTSSMPTEFDMKSGVLALSGELTVYSAAELRELLSRSAGGSDEPLEVDLAEVTEIDTAGLQLLLLLRRRARASGRDLHIIAASNVVRETLSLCGLTNLLVFKDVEAAS